MSYRWAENKAAHHMTLIDKATDARLLRLYFKCSARKNHYWVKLKGGKHEGWSASAELAILPADMTVQEMMDFVLAQYTLTKI